MEGSVRIARIFGVDVHIHFTWGIAVGLITWSLAVGFFPMLMPGLATESYWLLGLAGALMLFVSVLVHEFAHSLVALQRGLPVENITLFVFGGVSNIRAEAEQPRDEFAVTVVGPLSSLGLAALFWGLFQTGLGPAPVRGLIFYLAVINLLLAVFNVLPGFPLDGGRILRSLLWKTTGSFRRATEIATYVGQAFALVLIGWGVFQVFEGNLLAGFWIAFIGLFLFMGAEASRRQVTTQETFRGIRVGTLMHPNAATVSPWTSVAEMVREYVFHRGQRALPVVENDFLVGIVTTVDVRQIPPEEWETTDVRQVMTRDRLHTVRAEDDLSHAIRLMAEHDVNQLPVVQDGGRVVGLLTRAEIVRSLELSKELGLRGPPVRSEQQERRVA